MSCSKPLPPFVCDSLYYLNRNQLERFSIVCRPLKNFIGRYLHSKPYRIFDQLLIRGGSYALIHNGVHWHPNREDYSVQQFLATQKCSIECIGTDPAYYYYKFDYPTQKCSIERTGNDSAYYSFAEMRPYLGPTVRIKKTTIFAFGGSTCNAEHIEQMESISYLWRDNDLFVRMVNAIQSRIGAEDIDILLNSPMILQCRELLMINAHFSFKDYNVLYAVKVIEIFHFVEDEIDLWRQYWQQFFERSGVKPIVSFRHLRRENVENLLDLLHKAFSSAVSPSAFKIVFVQVDESLIEFDEKNYTSREKLVLKKGLPIEYQNAPIQMYGNYTLERSSM